MEQIPPFIRVKKDCIEIDLLIVPRARESKIVGVHDSRLKVAVAGEAIDGKANRELIRSLGELFEIPKKCVELIRGETQKRKTVAVTGIDLKSIYGAISPYLA